MKLWLAVHGMYYEGGAILGVFSTAELARAACDLDVSDDPQRADLVEPWDGLVRRTAARTEWWQVEAVTLDERTLVWP